MPMPKPVVPDLGPDNAIDLDKLGSADLMTYVRYPGMADGDRFFPNWRGCNPQGEIGDVFENYITVDMGLVTPDGMPVSIGNVVLTLLDQGWVFYSYQIFDTTEVDFRGEESLRRFFYVGKRAQAGISLRVAQCKESHDLAVAVQQLPGTGATFVTVPYQAMSAGDTVKLTLELFFAVGDPYDTLTLSHLVEQEQVGLPLVWSVPKADLQIIRDGFADVTYTIDYAVPTAPTVSATQRIWMIDPVAPLLPALTIKDFNGNDLDPDAYPDGITLQIQPYASMQAGDDLVLYAVSGTRVVQSWSVDVSTVDSGVLEFHLDHGWLASNNGQSLQLIYQYAREGAAGTGVPLALTLRKPLFLPAPIVEGATADGQNRGFIEARYLLAGVNIAVPDEAAIGASDTIKMHWEGYGDIGSDIADPIAGYPRKFQIKRTAVPANMGRRVKVFYKVSPPGEAATPSAIYDLEVRSTTAGWPALQIEKPVLINKQLSLATVPAGGVECLLQSWMFMAQGQRLRIRVFGLLPDGQEQMLNIRPGDQELVTEDEYATGKVWSIIPRPFLAGLRLDETLRIDVETSFDLGDSYVTFPRLEITLIA